jgi:hypothetical protein
MRSDEEALLPALASPALAAILAPAGGKTPAAAGGGGA